MNKVLLVEDDTLLVEMYRDKFIHEGFEVQTAVNGQDGIEKMKTFKPDAVILDLIMPKMSGYDVLKVAKDDPILNKIPVLILTNIYTDTQSLIKNWGAKYVLLKSNYTPEDIVTKVREMLTAEKN